MKLQTAPQVNKTSRRFVDSSIGDGNAQGRTPCVQNDESYQECQRSVKSVNVFSYLTQLGEFSPFPISQDLTWPDKDRTRVKCVIMS